ncbi:hypothetical protein SH661x_003269 [Planctomicrobium sp. SH661]|uniref:hypothetical protein n=1 Tax=Planctomicrobium sp. SH661 TaxID=3448124 RepID=UPI003F5C38BC
MRALLIVIAIIIVLLLIGWITIQTNGRNQATVTVDTVKMEKDTHEIVEKGSEALEETGKTLQNAVERERAEETAP